MKEQDFAFAVGAVRALENTLLPPAFWQTLTECAGFEEALSLLAEKGIEPEGLAADPERALETLPETAWREIAALSPDGGKSLSFLIVRNDFHNLKAILKGMVLSKDVSDLFLSPSLLDPQEVQTAIRQKEFSSLPPFLAESARLGYEILTASIDGQRLDLYLDAAALSAAADLAKACGVEDFAEMASAQEIFYNWKVALRLARHGAREDLLEVAFSAGFSAFREDAARACRKGEEEVLHFMEQCGFEEMAESWRTAPEEGERALERLLSEKIGEIGKAVFGPGALARYYRAKESEWKNLTVILTGKKLGLSPDRIRRNMREINGI